jgi:tetratricopeptide (TPR) repeat protein
LLEEAERQYEAGRFEAAQATLERARALHPAPAIEFDLALTLRQLGQDGDALAAFERFLAALPPEDASWATRRREAEWHVEALRARLTPAPEPRLASPPPAASPPTGSAPESVLTHPAPAPSARPPLYRRGWFWAAASAVAAVAVLGAVLAVRGDEPAAPLCPGGCALGEYGVSPGEGR